MRILILYVSANSGHQRAAIAIERALRQIDRKVEIAIFNYLGYINPLLEKIVTYTYFFWIKIFPKFWNRLYDHVRLAKRLSPLTNRINERQTEKFIRFLKWFKPDAVACTQAFPCGVVASFKKKEGNGLKLMAVITDYIAHIYWVHDPVDTYIVATEEAKVDLINKGVNSEKIEVLGIPIDPAFAHKHRRDQIARDLGLSPEKTTVLITGGGQGYGPIEDIVTEIIKLNIQIQIVIITGTNTYLQERLTKFLNNTKGVKIFGFVTNISEIMDMCDIIITKPGGLTTSEAMAKGIPMILTSPIPGQEDRNKTFFIKNRMAIAGDSPDEAAVALKRFLSEPGLLEEYKRNIFSQARPMASVDIARRILSN